MFSVIVRALDGKTKRKITAAGMTSALLAVSIVTTLGFMTGAFYIPPTGHPSELTFTIDSIVSGEFADFIPYEKPFTPNSPTYVVNPGLSNVVNLDQYSSLPSEVSQMIVENGFAVTSQSPFKHIHEILVYNDERGIPSFVSSDAVLHAYHVLYDLALREIEVYSFWDLLRNLTDSLLDVTFSQYETASEGRWQDAALRNLMFFAVAMSLIDNEWVIPGTFPAEVEPAVENVLTLIEGHSSMTAAWFMGYLEDFTQFVPRGHYTRSVTLQRYFKAMMWYGRVSFRLQPEKPPTLNEAGKDYTAQAILLSLALTHNVSGISGTPVGLDIWDALYEPTAFFVGAADDLVPAEYLSLIESIYGTEIDIADLDNETFLEQFIEEALELREPLILGHPMMPGDDLAQTMGLRFMGQRYIPDSYILSQLVYDNVGTLLNPRLMPKGLDVMAAFGSNRAWDLLEDDKNYVNYVSQMKMLWNQIGNMTADEWTQNLYYLWLYSLLPLLSEPGEGYPFFMQSDAWVDKQLSTALASWTELRHDTILYAKQSYGTLTGLPPQIKGYVEPVPNLYARLASLCQMMITGLDSRSLLSSLISEKLGDLLEFLLSLQAISIKELEGTTLNDTEYRVIQNSGYILEKIVTFPHDSELLSNEDKDMAVIADVHTDPNSGEVLEEAVGRPMVILVAVKIEGDVILTRGAVFSYYEFTWPMNDRPTDESWQDMLDQGTEPSQPVWTTSFIVEWEMEFYVPVYLDSAKQK
ncbi:MAG: DUF3160 domain-containing protein [Candidatus Thorarchaeota archaeon]